MDTGAGINVTLRVVAPSREKKSREKKSREKKSREKKSSRLLLWKHLNKTTPNSWHQSFNPLTQHCFDDRGQWFCKSSSWSAPIMGVFWRRRFWRIEADKEPPAPISNPKHLPPSHFQKNVQSPDKGLQIDLVKF